MRSVLSLDLHEPLAEIDLKMAAVTAPQLGRRGTMSKMNASKDFVPTT